MKIEYLDEFASVAKYLNFNQAAQSCHISVSVLSRHISDLEEEFGLVFFNRSTRSVSLTGAGKAFLSFVIPVLHEYENLRVEMRNIKKGYEGYLKIGLPYYGAESYLGDIPQLFEKQFPSIKLEYKVGGLNEVLRYLYEDIVDVSVLPNFGLSNSNNIEFFEVFKERLGVLVSIDNPLAAKTQCSITELKNETFFGVENNYSNNSWNLTLSLCNKAGFEPDPPVFFNSSETAIMAIRRNEGVFVLGEHMKIHESPKLAFLLLTEDYCYRPVGLCCKQDNKSLILRNFIRFAQKAYPENKI